MKTDQEIRLKIKALYGGKNAVVKRNGEIHVRGVMPRSCVYGWYLYGFTDDPYTVDRLWGVDKLPSN